MSSLRKTLTAIAGLVVLLVATPCLLAQAFPQDSELYGGWGGNQINSRNIPAGSVVDPGSQILYILDTAVNLREQAREESGDDSLSDLEEAKWADPLSVTRSDLFEQGELKDGAIARNFISITNTHPTQAVTIHFRYFNDECDDLLDFLLVLTCNDTLIFDPFDFDIPNSAANTGERFFTGSLALPTISSQAWGSGRFLLFAHAAGASYEPNNSGLDDDNAELRYPNEFIGMVDENHHCDSLKVDTYFGDRAGPFGNNLHVFNSAAVAFNYLVGSQTWGKLVPDNPGVQQAWGLNAWTRPAVDGWRDWEAEESNTDIYPYSELGLEKLAGAPNSRNGRRHPDGDGPPLVAANDFRILTGYELVPNSDQDGFVAQNMLHYRNDVHGGDTGRLGVPDLNPASLPNDFSVWWGALGTTSLFGVDPANQVLCFLSIMDDYNGSGESFTSLLFVEDRSYNISGAETTYVLQIFDYMENIFDIPPDEQCQISPCDPGEITVLKITVDCLRVWVGSSKIPTRSVEDLQISELDLVSNGATAHVGQNPGGSGDRSQGWIRFVRDNTEDGTWRPFETGLNADSDAPLPAYGVFTTIAFQSIVEGGLGAAWWLPAVASDPWVSSTGHQTCFGLCENGAMRDTSAASNGSPWIP